MQTRDEYGRWTTDKEPNVYRIQVKLSKSLRDRVEAVAGDRIADWFREAIREKLEKDASTP